MALKGRKTALRTHVYRALEILGGFLVLERRVGICLVYVQLALDDIKKLGAEVNLK